MSKLSQGAEGNTVAENIKLGGMYYSGKGALIPITVGGLASTFFDQIRECLEKTSVTGDEWYLSEGLNGAITNLTKHVKEIHKKGGKVIFLGNGGSAAIASHMAVDWTKNGGIRSIALNDAPTLTCLANDFGYESVFAKQLEYYSTKKDMVVIVSSSGKSENIIKAAKFCQELECKLVTLSGMNPNNYLRRLGSLNFYVPASDYGLVELSHLCILHSVVSL